MAEDKKKEDVDPRLEFVSTCVLKTYRMKQDKWQKLMSSDDKVTTVTFPLVTTSNECNPSSQTTIYDWLNNPKEAKLYFGLGASGGLMAFKNFPGATKSKTCYFIRKEPIALTQENIRSVRIFLQRSKRERF